MCNERIGFVFPVDGDCINTYDGRKNGQSIVFTAKVSAPEDCEIYINKRKAEYKDGLYQAEIALTGYKNAITAKDKNSGDEICITVFKLYDAVNKFRISSDDNILFLQDITKYKDVYKSIFENPYLAMYKKAHDEYGAKVHLNLFYEFIPTDDFKEHTEYFNLTMMTDKFKSEFEENSDWLKLAFHAKTEYPDMPYKYATAEQITEDCVKVCREIIRFAGEKCITNTTTIHWGEANRECVRALRALGFRTLTGYLTFTGDGEPSVSYYLDKQAVANANERDFWYDKSEDMMFGRIDIVLNLNDYNWVMEEMQRIINHPGRCGFISMMIHEQYFHPDYKGYLPDFENRVLDACRFLRDNGYAGTLVSEMTEEKNLCESVKTY